MSPRTFTAGAAAAAALLPLLAGCSDEEPANASGSTPSSTAADEAPALPGGVTRLPDPEAGSTVQPGRYRVPLGDTLAFDIGLGAPTSIEGDGLYLSTPDFVLKTELATDRYGVPTDACHGDGISPVGPSVADLVKAIRTQPGLQVDRPDLATFDGAHGKHLRVRIDPAFDVSTCRDGQVNLPGVHGTNNNVTPAYVGEWWILDVSGQRVVVQGMCDPCNAISADRIHQTVGSLAFTTVP